MRSDADGRNPPRHPLGTPLADDSEVNFALTSPSRCAGAISFGSCAARTGACHPCANTRCSQFAMSLISSAQTE